MFENSVKITAEPGKRNFSSPGSSTLPRELVFNAFTDPELYKQWIGPWELTTEIDVFQSVNGGRWRYIQKDPEENEYAFHGVNHEVLTPERIIGTFEFEGLPETGHVILQTLKIESLPEDRTRIVDQSVFQSVEDQDGMLQSGMEMGVNESYQRLEELKK